MRRAGGEMKVRQGARCGILALVLTLGLLPALAVRAEGGRPIPAKSLIKSVVFIAALVCDTLPPADGSPTDVPFAKRSKVHCQDSGTAGSGTIIDDHGTVLTNAHVVHPWLGGAKSPRDKIGWYLVFYTIDPKELPKPAYWAKVVVADDKLDLALINPAYQLDGQPVAEGEIHTRPIAMAAPGSVQVEDPVRVFGYPGIGGEQITITRGQVAGFDPDPDVPELGGAAWIKSDVEIGHGNSGGTAVNDDGQIIGVPTQIKDEKMAGGSEGAGQIAYIRPIPEAYDLLTKQLGPEATAAPAGTAPANATAPAAETPAGTAPAPKPTRTPRSRPKPPAGDTVTLVGTLRYVDDDSPIAGWDVYVLAPGVTFDSWDQKDPSQVFGTATTDQDGNWQLDKPVKKQTDYQLCVFGPNGRGTCFDKMLNVPANASGQFTVDLGIARPK